MRTKVFRAVIIGAPASGKGTISERIVKKYGLMHIAPGNILRQNVAENTELGKKVEVYMVAGKLVPDHLVINSILERLQEVGDKAWLLDGFPRTIPQAKKLQEHEMLDAVINLDVPHDVIIDRARERWVHMPSGRVYNTGFNAPKVPGKDDVTGEPLSQRSDDKPDIVAERLRLYQEAIAPILKYYNDLKILNTFKGSSTPEIWPKVDAFMEECRKKAPHSLQNVTNCDRIL